MINYINLQDFEKSRLFAKRDRILKQIPPKLGGKTSYDWNLKEDLKKKKKRRYFIKGVNLMLLLRRFYLQPHKSQFHQNLVTKNKSN